MSDTYRVPAFAGVLPPLRERTILHVLRANAAHRPDAVAVSDATSFLTHAQLLDRGMEVAAGLRGRGVGPGDRVALMLDNHVDNVLAWIGISLSGAVMVPVNTAYKGAFLAHVLRDSEASAALVEATYLDRVTAAGGASLPTMVRRPAEPGLPFLSGPARLAVEAAPHDITAIFYTSGTTGASKGVLTPHAQAYGYATPVHMGAASPDDTSYVALPLFHVGGLLWGVYNALIAGGAAHVAGSFSASTFWTDVNRTGSTFAMLTGAMVSFLNSQPTTDGEDGSTLRRVCLAPVPSDVDEFCTRFGVTYSTGYGSTEAAAPMVAPHGVSRGGSVGWMRPDFEGRVVDEWDVEVPDGDVGELIVRPTEPWTMFQGYVGRPEATAAAWRNLWFHTGDAVVRTSEGEHILVDRLKDSIRRRGENVSSMEVEAAANTHPSITETAAIAVPSAHSEDEILLLALPAIGARIDPEALYRHLVDTLPYFAVPRYIALVDDFARTGSNKIQKQPLREAGLPASHWDAEAHGLRATRHGLIAQDTTERVDP